MRDDQTRHLALFPDEPADAGRTAGLKRLSRLTWRVTQLGAIAAVGFATVFARTAPAQTLASHPAPAPRTSSASPAPTASATHPVHRKRHGTSGAGQTSLPAAQPGSQPSAQPARSSSPRAKSSPTLAPPATAPAAPPPTTASAPAPVPTVSSASTGHG